MHNITKVPHSFMMTHTHRTGHENTMNYIFYVQKMLSFFPSKSVFFLFSFYYTSGHKQTNLLQAMLDFIMFMLLYNCMSMTKSQNRIKNAYSHRRARTYEGERKEMFVLLSGFGEIGKNINENKTANQSKITVTCTCPLTF